MQIESELLKHLHPIKQLQRDHRLNLLDQSHILALQPGDEIRAGEHPHWFLYLLKGKLDLIDSDNQGELIAPSDERALHPLFNQGEGKTRVIAQTGCIIAQLDKELFYAYMNQELLSGEELETVEMNDIEGQLFNVIVHAFNMGQLKLPSLPDIAIKVKQATADVDANAQNLARIVSADPSMAARLINVANGPLNRGIEPIGSIQTAVVRLGLKTTRELVIGFALKQLFNSRSPVLKDRMHQLYDQSVDVAAISFALSKHSRHLSPDHVMLAGLLHQIGVIPILAYIEETGLQVSSDKELEDIIERLSGAVGSMVIKHWGLPTDLLAVVEEQGNWSRNTGDEVDVCDLVIIAQIYSRLKHHQLKGLPKIDQVPAFRKLFPGKLDKDFASKVLEDAHEEVASIIQLLN